MDKIELTQADRDAAAQYWVDVACLYGTQDEILAEAFSHHRLATRTDATPVATDVAALVEAAKEAARGFDATNLLIEAVSGSPSIMVETFAERLRQAIAPFTKG